MRAKVALGAFAYILTSACGGGGDGSSPPSPPMPPATSNTPPTLSISSASVTENRQANLLTASASDPDSASLTFSISGGADASRFAINSVTGVISSNAPLDFDEPADSDMNNVYEITVTVSDGSAIDSESVTITVSNVPNDGIMKIAGSASGDRFVIARFSDSTSNLIGTPDYDGDGADDLAVSLTRSSSTTNENVGLVFLSTAFASENPDTFDVSVLTSTEGLRLFVSGLAAPPPATVVFSRLGRSVSTTSIPFLSIIHPLAAGGAATTQLLGGNIPAFSALGGSIDVGLAPTSPVATSSLDGSLLMPVNTPDFTTFNTSPGLTVVVNTEFQNVSDITGDGVEDYAFAADPGASSNTTVYIVSGAALNADADGIIDQADLAFPDIYQIELAATDTELLFGKSGDIDGDGVNDIVISSSGPLISGQGIAYIIYSAGLTSDPDGNVSVSGLPNSLGIAIAQDGAGPSPGFSWTVDSIGDIDADGNDDLFISIGANRSTPSLNNARSSAFIVSGAYLNSLTSENFSLPTFNSNAGIEIRPEPIDDVTVLDTDGFGGGVARAFDSDNDGILDLAILTPFAETFSGSSFADAVGAIYVIPSSRVIAAREAGGVIDLGEEF